MIKIENDNFNKAIEREAKKSEIKKRNLAIVAKSSPQTLNKIMAGNADIQLLAAEKLAKHVGLGVRVSFFPLPKEEIAG